MGSLYKLLSRKQIDYKIHFFKNKEKEQMTHLVKGIHHIKFDDKA